MKSRIGKTILAGVPATRYVGRLDQIDRLYLHAVSGAPTLGVRISAPPSAGASELLRQVYDRLFNGQRFVVPFYFALRRGDGTGFGAAARFVYQFLLQTIAFRRNDPALLSSSPDICELSKLAPLADAEWVSRLCDVCPTEGPLNDERAFMTSALAAPIRTAARAKMQVCVMIDDLHESTSIDGGRIFLDELSAVFSKARLPLILAGRRRFPITGLDLENVELGFLPRGTAANLIEMLAVDADLKLSEQTRDLIAVQFGGNPRLIRLITRSARERRMSLLSYRDVEQLYSRELLSGGLGDHFNNIFERAAPDPGTRRKVMEALHSATGRDTQRFSLESFRESLDISANDFTALTESLDLEEVIFAEGGSARLSRSDILHDYIDSRVRLDSRHDSAAAVEASTVTEALKRAPRAMSRVYRVEAAAGLEAVMLLFDLQDVPRSLMDYRLFRDRYKGTSDDEARKQLAIETDTLQLPQISHAASIAEHYPPFAVFTDPEHTAVGVGFTDRAYREQDEVVWLAAEIDSKLEADRAITEEWCGRLDAAAAACEFINYRIWLVAPEGFSDGALDLLAERDGIGSSRREVDLLREFLIGNVGAQTSNAVEYELVIPVGEDTELIAAHSLEEIARRYDFPAKAVNQIKTALVEACINAAEHGLSPDRKIYQKFAVDNEKIVITISNRGIRLIDENSVQPGENGAAAEGRRGWGLSLMRGLMDDVHIEHVDDGTRIVMTKFLKASKAR